MKRNTLLITGLVLAAFLLIGTLAWAETEPAATAEKTQITKAKMEKAEARKIAIDKRQAEFVKVRDKILATREITNPAERSKRRAELAEQVAVRLNNTELRSALNALRTKTTITPADIAAIDARIKQVHRENLENNATRILDRARKIDTRVINMVAPLRVRASESPQKVRLEVVVDRLEDLEVKLAASITAVENAQASVANGEPSKEEFRALQRAMVELRFYSRRLVDGIRLFADRVPAPAETMRSPAPNIPSEVAQPAETIETAPAQGETIQPPLSTITSTQLVEIEGAVAPPASSLSAEVDASMIPAASAESAPAGGDQ